jgi:hypothetical protein
LISEKEINLLLDEFIDKYLKVVSPFATRARDIAVEQLRMWLSKADASDFKTGEAFAKKAIEQIGLAYEAVFDSVKTKKAVGNAIKAIYSFFRLNDETPFGTEGSPIQMKFGAPDKRAVEFFKNTENFYLSKYLDNSDAELRKFFNEEFVTKGKALFGNQSSEELDLFRKAAGGKLDNVNDRGVQIIVRNGVQRARNYAHILSLHQGEIEEAEYVAVLDKRTSHICETLDGKKIRIGVAAATVEELTALEPGDYAQRMFQSKDAKEMRVANTDPEASAKYFSKKITDGYVDDDFVSSGLALPPLHPNCRTRLIAVV